MSNAVFTQNPSSKYDDRPGVAYHFPRRYLNVVQDCIGDWVVIYEGKKGALGYTAVIKLSSVTLNTEREDHFYAWYEAGTQWEFEQVVPRNSPNGVAYENSLKGPNGRAQSGGASVSAVRRLSFDEFSTIVSAGLKPMEGENALPREAARVEELQNPTHSGFADDQSQYDVPDLVEFRPEILVSRPARDASFVRMVKAAYGGRCAISGLDLRNGGGRAEVQAAHIRSVKSGGPDTVENGLALSGTLHWMFDRGLGSTPINSCSFLCACDSFRAKHRAGAEHGTIRHERLGMGIHQISAANQVSRREAGG